MKHRLLTVGAAAALAALALSGCAAETAPSGTGGSGEPATGGTLTVLEFTPAICLYGPGTGYTPNGVLFAQLTDKLTYQNPETLEIEPWLAESWEVNEDATEYTFVIRDGVTFSDGTPLDAAAVAANFDTYGTTNTELKLPVAEFVNNYAGSEVIDDSTVRLSFSAPSPGFLQATSVIGAGIVSPEILELPYEEQCQIDTVIGSGPFVVDSVVPEQEVKLVAREDYDWAPPSFEHQGRAYLDGIDIIVTPEASVRVGALTSGQADLIRKIDPFDEGTVTDAGFDFYAPTTNGVVNTLNLRMTNSILRDLRVREALRYGTDIEEIQSTLLTDGYPIATSIVASNALGYADQSDLLVYDQDRAIELLDEAGWEPGPDGIREKDGQRLELSVFVETTLTQGAQQLELIAQQWAEIGVALNIRPADAGTKAVDNLDPEKTALQHTWVGRADQDVLKAHLGSGNRNVLLSDDAVLDEMLAKIASEPDPELRNQYSAEAQRYAIEQAYVIPIVEEPLTYAAGPYVQGVEFEAVGRPMFYNTWLDQ